MSERQEFSQMNEAFAEEGFDIDEYVALQQELNELKKENGTLEEEKGVSRMISKFFERQDAREKVLINKKRLIWMAVLFGWAGTHRFMLRQPGLGMLYLCTCWSGYSMAMTIVDVLIYAFLKPDENGNILV